MGLFDKINEEAEKKENEVQQNITEFPEAYQVMTTEKSTSQNGTIVREVIVDTFVVDKKKGIVPVGKAKIKAQKMKEAFPDKSFYVVEIVHRIVANY